MMGIPVTVSFEHERLLRTFRGWRACNRRTAEGRQGLSCSHHNRPLARICKLSGVYPQQLCASSLLLHGSCAVLQVVLHRFPSVQIESVKASVTVHSPTPLADLLGELGSLFERQSAKSEDKPSDKDTQ